MKSSVKDKVVIITGSSKGIGKATAIYFGLKGAKIVLNGREINQLEKAESELKELNIDCIGCAADVSIYDDCEKLIKTATDHYKKIDILINNAGTSTKGLIKNVNAEIWQKVLNLNTLGQIFPTKAALPSIIDSKGSILFISSIGARMGLPGHSTYSVSKMALTSFSEALRAEVAQHSVHVGMIYVGFTRNENDKTILGANGNFDKIVKRPDNMLMAPETVARKIYNTVCQKKDVRVLSIPGHLQGVLLKIAFIKRFLLQKMLDNYYKNYKE